MVRGQLRGLREGQGAEAGRRGDPADADEAQAVCEVTIKYRRAVNRNFLEDVASLYIATVEPDGTDIHVELRFTPIALSFGDTVYSFGVAKAFIEVDLEGAGIAFGSSEKELAPPDEQVRSSASRQRALSINGEAGIRNTGWRGILPTIGVHLRGGVRDAESEEKMVEYWNPSIRRLPSNSWVAASFDGLAINESTLNGERLFSVDILSGANRASVGVTLEVPERNFVVSGGRKKTEAGDANRSCIINRLAVKCIRHRRGDHRSIDGARVIVSESKLEVGRHELE